MSLADSVSYLQQDSPNHLQVVLCFPFFLFSAVDNMISSLVGFCFKEMLYNTSLGLKEYCSY